MKHLYLEASILILAGGTETGRTLVVAARLFSFDIFFRFKIFLKMVLQRYKETVLA